MVFGGSRAKNNKEVDRSVLLHILSRRTLSFTTFMTL